VTQHVASVKIAEKRGLGPVCEKEKWVNPLFDRGPEGVPLGRTEGEIEGGV